MSSSLGNMEEHPSVPIAIDNKPVTKVNLSAYQEDTLDDSELDQEGKVFEVSQRQGTVGFPQALVESKDWTVS